MKTVRIALTTKKGWSLKSELIKWRMKVLYSHACVILKDEALEMYDVYQASHGQVHEIGLDIFKEINDLVKVYHLEMNEEQYKRGLIWLKKQRGKKYSFLGLIACTIPFMKKLGIGRDGDKEFICSEYALRYVEVSYDVEIRNKNEDYVTPAQLENILEQIQVMQLNSKIEVSLAVK